MPRFEAAVLKAIEHMGATCQRSGSRTALNGAWGRERQPAIPISIDEVVVDGIAAAKAGAAIIHLHAYDSVTGRQSDMRRSLKAFAPKPTPSFIRRYQ